MTESGRCEEVITRDFARSAVVALKPSTFWGTFQICINEFKCTENGVSALIHRPVGFT